MSLTHRGIGWVSGMALMAMGLGTSFVEATPIHIGVRGGPTFMEYSTKPGAYYSGPNAGLMGEFGLSDQWSVQSGLLYMFIGDRDRSTGVNLTTTISWWTVPVQARFKVLDNPLGCWVFAGPHVALRQSATFTNEATKVTTDLSPLYQSLDLGVSGGLGVKFPFGVTLDVGYTLGLTNISTVPGQNMTTKTFRVLLGYDLF